MESLLQSGANTTRLARSGRMDATPDAGDSTQAMAAWYDDLPGTAEAWGIREGGKTGGVE